MTKEKCEADRKAEAARREADPLYQKRQTDLARYAKLLSDFGVKIENDWNNQEDFRIELDGIKSEKMEALIEAIRKVLR